MKSYNVKHGVKNTYRSIVKGVKYANLKIKDTVEATSLRKMQKQKLLLESLIKNFYGAQQPA